MALTPTQVEQIINLQQQQGGGKPFGDNGGGTGTGTTQGSGGFGDWRDTVDLAEQQRLAFSNANLYQQIFDSATPGDQAAYLAYNAGFGDATAEIGAMIDANGVYSDWAKRELSVSNPTTRGGNANLPPSTQSFGGTLYEWVQNPWSKQWELKPLASTASGGSGSYASSQAGQQAQLAYQYAALAQQKAEADAARAEQMRQFGITNPEEELARQQGYLSQRATVGEGLGNLQRGLANDAYTRSIDPGNFPAYLAASAGMPQGRGAIDQLLGSGAQIQAPEGSNPLADPRFKALMDELYGYAKPTSLSTVQQIAAQNGGTLPQSFYDYTGTQNPNVQQHAKGGSQMITEPVMGIGLQSGQPQFLAGEAGPERLNFEPQTHSHSDGGIPIPHSHAKGDVKHEHMDRNSPAAYADGGTADISPDPTEFFKQWPSYTADQQTQLRGMAAGIQPYGYDQPNPDLERVKQAYATNPQGAATFFSQKPEDLERMFGTSNGATYTPAQGTSIALGKGLQQLGWVPQSLVQQLLAGNAPTSGSVDEATLMRLPPSYRQLLMAAIKARVGSAGLQDYTQSQQDYALPGLGTAFPQANYT